MSNDFGKGAGLGFLAGWFTGRRGRRRNRTSPILFIFGALGLFMSCAMTLFVAPASFFQARAVADYPRPTAAEIDGIDTGTAVLFQAQISPDEVADDNGLVFAYTELRQSPNSSDSSEGRNQDSDSGSTSSSWERVQPAPTQIELRGEDGRFFTITLPPDISYSSATTVELADDGSNERRTVGFLPGQTVTVNGTWEGNATLIGEAVHAGTAEAYQTTLNRAPGQLAIFGLICGGIALLFLGLGFVLRLSGN